VGRDINSSSDELLGQARAIVTPDKKPDSHVNKKEIAALQECLDRLYKAKFRSRYYGVYPYCGGAAHSSVMVLVFGQFARLVISTANLTATDMVLDDNVSVLNYE
jgi:hypothetical protein